MAEAAIVTEASIRWLPWIRTKPIVLALAFLTSLLEGVKRPSERRFFSALMKSGIAGGDSVRTERAWSRGGVFVITTAATWCRCPGTKPCMLWIVSNTVESVETYQTSWKCRKHSELAANCYVEGHPSLRPGTLRLPSGDTRAYDADHRFFRL